MKISDDDHYIVKNEFLLSMFEEAIADFDKSLYEKCRHISEYYKYNHTINELLINNEISGIEILQKDTHWDEGSYSQVEFIVFKFKDNTYKIDFQEGSYGYKYKLDVRSLKSVEAKTKQVTYYE